MPIFCFCVFPWRIRQHLRELVFMLVVWVSLGSPAAAQIDYPDRRTSFTPGELAMLPEYCKNMQGFPGYEGREGNRWRAMMGSDFQHIHHYCRGLRDVYFTKFAVPSPTQRRFLWERAINEYNYVISNSRSTMPLLPEILQRRGEAQVVLGRTAEADSSFERARQLKPDYWPAYTAWANQLIRLKLYDRARDLLQEGLRQAPGTPALYEQLARLPDGKQLVAQARREEAEAARAAQLAASEPASKAAMPAASGAAQPVATPERVAAPGPASATPAQQPASQSTVVNPAPPVQ